MGCGKSKHADVASGNTVLKRKTSTVQSEKRKEIKTEIIRNNVDEVVIPGMVQKENEIVKEVGSSNDVKVENEHVQEERALEKSKENGSMMEKKEETISEQKFDRFEDGKEDSLIKENERILGDAVAEVKEPAAEENKAISEDFEVQKEDSLTNSNQKVDACVVEQKGSSEENIVMAKKSEGEKEEPSEKNDEKANNALKESEEEKKTSEKNDEKVNNALKEKELEEEMKTKSGNFESGKGNSLEENSQQVNDEATEVREPEEEETEKNITGDVSLEEETLVKEEDSNKDMEALTLKSEENVVKTEDNTKTNIVSASEGEEKDSKTENVQSEKLPSSEDGENRMI